MFVTDKFPHVSLKYGGLLGNTGKKRVPDQLLQEIEKIHLTDQQKKIFLHANWFLKPSTLPYNLSHEFKGKTYFSQDKQDLFVNNYFKNMTNGTFFEVGAADGATFSNSLFSERVRHWTGVLIEPNTDLCTSLVSVHRKSYTINSCLSLDEKLNVASFLPAKLLGGIEKSLKSEEWMMNRVQGAFPYIETEEVLCIPVKSILKEINMPHINFFSLDVEGAELDILKSIPFNVVTIDFFMIEYFILFSKRETLNRLNAYRRFFKELGIYKEFFKGKFDVGFARQ